MVRKTVSSHHKDNMKHDDGMTTSSHTRDTAGGGRAIFSNADSIVPTSILQQRHTASTDNVKYESEITASSRARDTAGGRRGAFSNAYSDVPMSILPQRHTSNTHRNDDNSREWNDMLERRMPPGCVAEWEKWRRDNARFSLRQLFGALNFNVFFFF